MWHETPRSLTFADRLIVALCGLGALFMSYLTYVHYHSGGGALCDLGAGLSCQIVNQSVYSEIFGIPLSILGIAYFLGVAALVFAAPKSASYHFIQVATAGTLVFSLYLTGVEVFWLGSVCIFCEFSKLAMALIMLITLRDMRLSGVPVNARRLAVALLAGLFFTGASRFIQGS